MDPSFSVAPPLLDQFDPDPRVLFELCRQNMDHLAMVALATADYGHDARLHERALKPILAGKLPDRLAWHPREVLSLTRWSAPAVGDSQGQWLRLFACTVLLLVPGGDADRDTIALLVKGAHALGREAKRATAQQLAWQLLSLAADSADKGQGALRGALTHGLLSLALALEHEDAVLDLLCTSAESGPPSEPGDLAYGDWQSLATRAWHDAAQSSPSVQARVQNLARKLRPELC